MPLLGDLIVQVRNIANDPCQTLGQPVAPTGIVSGSAGIFNSATVFGYITYLTNWGETIPSTEIGPFNCTTNALALSGMVPPYSAVGARFYFGFASGQEFQYLTFLPTATATVGLTGSVPISGVAPYKSSAYLPDTDGDLVSAFEIYRWINNGLTELGRLAGGILDQTGVAMAAGAADVVIPGWWLKIQYTWHNGWLALPEQQSYTWLQSPVTGIPGISTLWKNASQQVLGTWPQPSTAPGSTTLTADMSATDTLANVADPSGFTASPGLCQIGNEVMSYSQANSSTLQLTQMVRGYGGTVAAAHPSGAAVTQLIFRLLGRRMPTLVSVGQSGMTLDVPQGWDAVLDGYLLAQFKLTEQNTQEATVLLNQFKQDAIELRDDQIPLMSKQVGGLYPLGGAAQTLAEIMDTVIVE